MPADVRSAVRTAMAVAIVSSTLSAAVAPQAQAREWRPRRHHRTLKDEVLNNARAIPVSSLKGVKQLA